MDLELFEELKNDNPNSSKDNLYRDIPRYSHEIDKILNLDINKESNGGYMQEILLRITRTLTDFLKKESKKDLFFFDYNQAVTTIKQSIKDFIKTYLVPFLKKESNELTILEIIQKLNEEKDRGIFNDNLTNEIITYIEEEYNKNQEIEQIDNQKILSNSKFNEDLEKEKNKKIKI